MKIFEIIRTNDLQSFYITADNPLNAIKIHWKNLDRIREDKQAQLFNTGNSYILMHNNDVYCLVYKIRKKSNLFS